MTEGQISHSFDGQLSHLKTHRAQVSMMTTNMKKCQLSGPDIEDSLQINGGNAVEALTLLKPQGCLCPSKDTSFTLA